MTAHDPATSLTRNTLVMVISKLQLPSFRDAKVLSRLATCSSTWADAVSIVLVRATPPGMVGGSRAADPRVKS